MCRPLVRADDKGDYTKSLMYLIANPQYLTQEMINNVNSSTRSI